MLFHIAFIFFKKMINKKKFFFDTKVGTCDSGFFFEYKFLEHFLELKYRISIVLLSFLFLIISNFCFVKYIVKFLEYPSLGIKFIQLAPNEYFFSTLKVTLYSSIVFLSPLIFSQLIVYLLPSCTSKEKNVISGLIILSFLLFGLSLIFSFQVLVPAALKFFLLYGDDVIEPLWSFSDYFDFLLFLTIGTVLSFQLPVIQIITGIFNIISAEIMLSGWKVMILFSTCLGAILTPSTDPVTQILLSVALIVLYMIGGLGILIIDLID
uniref:Sec-independent protein translocase component TatC n=1 Tax=Olisthodiscus luteus TaxID=83000 RepID=A0A7U0KSS7_OLILU|nr:Sec-independent protein translocase component TatC [Olisthodiscus luteus]QQW50548.1 Sec-independent protein translocase component TatC [Olisthodiscus luteus]